MTAADHANIIREALEGIDRDECEDKDGWWETSAGAKFGAEKKAIILAALDALQAQAEANPFEMAIMAPHDAINRAQDAEQRAEAAEAERHRLAEILSRVKQDAKADGNIWLVEFIDAALAHTEQP